MLLFFSVQHLLIKATMRKRIERRLQLATRGFEPHVRQITVRFRGANESKGGMDRLCTVSAKFRNGDHMSVSKTHSNAMAAISGALKQLRYSLASRVVPTAQKQHADAPARVTEYWIG